MFDKYQYFLNIFTYGDPYTTGGNPGEIFPSSAICDRHHPRGCRGETPSADEVLGEVPGENLMEEKLLIRVDQMKVTEEGNSLMTLMRRR